ncbi:XK-related protein 6-like [Haliotis cracherodii]|uniref:XK-related protein 6-like n=1 Tax=Haliotis cracherodii TaxID=6455 RepID=UPI0039E7528A
MAKIPLSSRSRGVTPYRYLFGPDSDEDEESDDLNRVTNRPSRKIETASRRRSDNLDGRIQTANRDHFYKPNEVKEDVIDYLTNDKKHQPIIISHDSRDMGVVRAGVPETPSSSTPLHTNLKFPTKQKNTFHYEFGLYELLIGLGSIILYFGDFGTDIWLVVKYFIKGEIFYGSVSLVLTAGPSVVTCGLGLTWYVLDYKREKEALTEARRDKDPSKLEKVNEKITPGYQWALRFIMTALQFGPVIRISEYIYNGWMFMKSEGKLKKHYYWLMLYEDVDACLLRLFESFLESAPQLTWQLYVWIMLKPEEDVVGLSLRLGSLMSSWLSLAVSLLSYHRSLRFSREEKAVMEVRSIPFYFIWRASEVGTRVLCLCLFASSFQAFVFIPVGMHWVIISVWLMCQKTRFYKDNLCFEKFFDIICGYVMIFCFLNLKEGHSRFRYLLYYALFYSENIAMLTVWFLYSSHVGEWFHVGGFIAILTMAGLHVVFQLLFYMCCHPTDNIKYCLPCEQYTCYELVCHDSEETADRVNVEMIVKRPSQSQLEKEQTQI